jgi:hypothetical protein
MKLPLSGVSAPLGRLQNDEDDVGVARQGVNHLIDADLRSDERRRIRCVRRQECHQRPAAVHHRHREGNVVTRIW